MEQFIVSARKYRPQVFADVVGQQAITNTLENAIKKQPFSSSFIIYGSTWCWLKLPVLEYWQNK